MSSQSVMLHVQVIF